MEVMTARRSLACVAAIAIVASATPASAVEFLEHYKVGMAAVESEDWDRVGDMMGRAIEIQPISKVRIKKALFFKPYLPHYYLGVSLYKSGDCVGALASWQESEAQEVVKKLPEHKHLEAARETCLQHLSGVDSTLAEAKRLVAAAGTASVGAWLGLEDLEAKGAREWESLSDRFQVAEQDLDKARVLIRLTDRDLEKLQRATRRAAKARDDFESISLASSKWLQVMASEQVELRAILNQLVVSSVRSLKATEYLEPYPSSIDRHRQRVESLVAHVGGLDTSASSDEVGGLAVELEQAISLLERSAVGPPPALTLAAEAFLTGQYSQVLEALAKSNHRSTKVSAQSHLLRAAALHALRRESSAIAVTRDDFDMALAEYTTTTTGADTAV